MLAQPPALLSLASSLPKLRLSAAIAWESAETSPGQATCSGFSGPHTLPNFPSHRGFRIVGWSILRASVMRPVQGAAHQTGLYSRFLK